MVESKISQTSHIFQIQELNPSIEETDDDLQLSKQFDIETCAKLLSVVLVLTLLIKGLRKKHLFYNNTVKLSSCKYILLRTIRI